MIFLTIGTQEPFDRLVRVVDELAISFKEIRFVAQISNGEYMVKNMETMDFLSPVEFDKLFLEAKLIIGHAGMGTIISALQNSKPIVIMPRIASLGEHRNEHQLATANKMKSLNYVHTAFSEAELKQIVSDLIYSDNFQPLHKLGPWASDSLIKSINNYIRI